MLMAAIFLVFVGWKRTSLKLYIGGPQAAVCRPRLEIILGQVGKYCGAV